MKTRLALILILASTGSARAAELNGSYRCQTLHILSGFYTNAGAARLQDKLSSMSCDTNKPFTTQIAADVTYATVCCVQK